MSDIFSTEHESVAVSEELLALLMGAYEQQGQVVTIPQAVVRNSGIFASSQTSGEIRAIRRIERTASTQTLTFSFA